MIKYFIYFSLCLAANPIDLWIENNKDVIKNNIKSVSFKIKIKSEIYDETMDSVFLAKIIVGEKKFFRFEIGPRVIVSNGEVWKSYDQRTNQIFIQKPDKDLERNLFSFIKYKSIKTIPFVLENDGGYRFKLIGKNDIKAYFDSKSDELKKVTIVNNDFKLEISQVVLSIENTLNFDIGNKNTDIFDLR